MSPTSSNSDSGSDPDDRMTRTYSTTSSGGGRRHRESWWDAESDGGKRGEANNEITFKLLQATGDRAKEFWVRENGMRELGRDAKIEGTLLKAKARGFVMTWLPRHFVLTPKSLRYYEADPGQDESARDRPLVSIDLSKISLAVERGGGHFEINAKRQGSTEPYRLCVDVTKLPPLSSSVKSKGVQEKDIQVERAEAHAKEWVDAINEAVRQAPLEVVSTRGRDQAVKALGNMGAAAQLRKAGGGQAQTKAQAAPGPEQQEQDALLPTSTTSASKAKGDGDGIAATGGGGSSGAHTRRPRSGGAERTSRVRNGGTTEFVDPDTDEINITVERSTS